MRTYLILILIIMIGVFSLWFQEDSKQTPDDVSLTDKHFPDYFMDNFSVTSMDETGNPAYSLKAQKMLHYADDDSAELEQPLIEFKQSGKQFTLSATRALYQQDANIVYLYDNVVIHQQSAKPNNELSIYTDYLKVDTVSKVAENEHPSRVKTAQAELNSTGLLLDTLNGTLILKSHVKGVYNSAR